MQVLGWVTLGVSAGRRQGLWRLWQSRGFSPYLRQAAIWCRYRPNPVWPKPPITLEKPKPGILHEIAQVFNMNDLSSHSQTKSGLAHRPLVCGHGSHSRLLEGRACLPARLLESSHASPASPHPPLWDPPASAQDILPTAQIISLLGLMLLETKAWGRFQLSVPSHAFTKTIDPDGNFCLWAGMRKGEIAGE